MQENKRLKIGITIGDMNGVGPEIILKTFADKRMLEFCTPVIYSSTKTLEFVKNTLNTTLILTALNRLLKQRTTKLI